MSMYSGLLPSGLSEADLSSDEDPNDAQLTAKHREEETQTNLSCHTDLDTQSDLNANVGDDCLPGISLDQWQRFKDLQKAKHDQMSSQPQTKRKRRHKKGGTSKQNCDTGQNRKLEEERKDNWKELTQYFGINDRFQPPPSNRPPLMSGLEKSIEGAIAEGDYQKAEELSDRLATRELAVKIAQAADCRDFEHNKREAEASRAAQKRRKQIAWGFDAKKRWETKSNMGFM